MVRAFSVVPLPAFAPIKAVFKEKTVFISTTIGAILAIHLRRGSICKGYFVTKPHSIKKRQKNFAKQQSHNERIKK